MNIDTAPSHEHADGQMTGLAGELFVAAELLRRHIQVSITFGNAKAIDLMACNAKTGSRFDIQVKALRQSNSFLLKQSKVNENHTYVFVLLGKAGEIPSYFIVPGRDLLSSPEKFGSDFQHPTMPGIRPRELQDYRDNWAIFDA